MSELDLDERTEAQRLADAYRIERFLLLLEDLWDMPRGALAPGAGLGDLTLSGDELKLAELEAAIEEEFDVIIVKIPDSFRVADLMEQVCLPRGK